MSNEQHPASVRPGPTAPKPDAVDEGWFDRLSRHMDIDQVLAAARALSRARHPMQQPGAVEVLGKLRVALAFLTDESERQPDSAIVAEYLLQVEHEMDKLRRNPAR